ncbi:unnamed protein product [Leptosia nina]|uniref:Uncharacterized protein n=1 Tax=Leptosia nina TaxID=320188 RepID=A0AAV1JFZ4_9NEOP
MLASGLLPAARTDDGPRATSARLEPHISTKPTAHYHSEPSPALVAATSVYETSLLAALPIGHNARADCGLAGRGAEGSGEQECERRGNLAVRGRQGVAGSPPRRDRRQAVAQRRLPPCTRPHLSTPALPQLTSTSYFNSTDAFSKECKYYSS